MLTQRRALVSQAHVGLGGGAGGGLDLKGPTVVASDGGLVLLEL